MLKKHKVPLLTSLFLMSVIFLVGCDRIQDAFRAVAPLRPKPASQEEPVVHGTVLAKVNNEVITLESFSEKIKNLESLSPDIKINTFDAKKEFLDDLITQELIYQEAKTRGIDEQKDVRDAIEEFKKGVMARQVILDETKGITITPTEIETFYNQYKKELATPADIRVREIVVSSEPAAKEIYIALLQGSDFATLARERSISPSASGGGDLGFVKRGEKFDKLDEVVSTLEAGQLSQIFKGPDGYYIVKVEEKKGGTTPLLAEVYEQIKNGLLQQKQAQRIQELTDKLKKEAKIEISEDLLR